ncbi:MAG: alpha/beta hydrolase-fold protein [Eubacteriales bacterium]|nr:alpha/beta hydrolase-fold protein [Eubacteriales bacterium]
MRKVIGVFFIMAGFMGGLFGCDNDSIKDRNIDNTTKQVTSQNVEEHDEVCRFQQKEDSCMKEMQIENPLSSEYLKKSDDVTYGELVKTSYYSTTCEKDRNVIVLLPAGYSEEKKYPVCYVLHGIFGDENSMIGDGESGTRIVIGNMMHKKQAEEMILVFPYMYASKTKDVCTAIDLENTLVYDNFVNDLVTDLMPFMEENYAVAAGRENTAVIGFSMGGRESLAIGLEKSDVIGYIGAIAPAPGLTPGKDQMMDHPGQFEESQLNFEGKEKPLLLMVCSGDSDSVVGTFPMSYHNIFNTNGVEHYWWEIAGSDHGDPAITNGLANFWRTIFK